jgi:threonine dehydratase
MTLSAQANTIAAMTERIAPRIAEHTVRTPLTPFSGVSAAGDATLLIKCEHQQRTGSFKLRGALSKILSLSPADRSRGVVTSSSGNHGLGVAHALSVLGGSGIVCVPESVSSAKFNALSRYAVEIRKLGRDAGETDVLGRQLAEELGLTYISPYNDPDVIAGQGTVGREIFEQLDGDHVDAVVVAVGGGGLISGVAASVKSLLSGTRIVGASPANDAAMAASVGAGQIVDIDASPTLSDGTAGGIEPGAITFALCVELVDEWVLVTEDQIKEALQLTIDSEHQLIEGAAAAALAAAIQIGRAGGGQTLAVVSCGANISTSTLRTALTPPGTA